MILTSFPTGLYHIWEGEARAGEGGVKERRKKDEKGQIWVSFSFRAGVLYSVSGLAGWYILVC